jgi:hypothetical protein
MIDGDFDYLSRGDDIGPTRSNQSQIVGGSMEKILANVRSISPRPECRQVILREGLLPDILRDARGRLFWDGLSARRPDGSRRLYGAGTPTRMNLELKLMAVEGLWGDLRSVTLSWYRYSLLRDAIDGRIRGSSVNASLWWPPNWNRREGKTTRQ